MDSKFRCLIHFIVHFRLKSKTIFANQIEEEEYFNNFYSNLTALKEHSYVKLPTYMVDLKKFYPHVADLKLNILKFKNDTISRAQELFTNMKEEYINLKKVVITKTKYFIITLHHYIYNDVVFYLK